MARSGISRGTHRRISKENIGARQILPPTIRTGAMQAD